jgi:hypothetical protein
MFETLYTRKSDVSGVGRGRKLAASLSFALFKGWRDVSGIDRAGRLAVSLDAVLFTSWENIFMRSL